MLGARLPRRIRGKKPPRIDLQIARKSWGDLRAAWPEFTEGGTLDPFERQKEATLVGGGGKPGNDLLNGKASSIPSVQKKGKG